MVRGILIMKQLTRIKLINWHMFSHESIDVQGHMLITGQNASGKSTILDAIQYVLSAGSKKFNKAANDGSQRTLHSYVHGKTGTENKPYLREGSVIAHIALEFYDTNEKMTQVLGVCIESNSASLKNLNEYFYKVDGALDDLWFRDDNVVRLYRELKQTIRHMGLNIDESNNKQERKRLLSQTMGVAHRYFDMIPKALAFKPIDDLHDFIFSYLLNEQELSLDDLRANIHHYQEMQKTFTVQQQKLDRLEAIVNTYYKYHEKEAELAVQTLSFDLMKQKEREAILEVIRKELNQLHLEAKGIESTKTTQESQLNTLDQEILNITNQLRGYQEYNQLERLKQDIIKLKHDLNVTKGAYQSFNDEYDAIKKDMMLISKSWNLPDLETINSNHDGESVIDRLNEAVGKYNAEIQKRIHGVELERSTLEKDVDVLSVTKQRLEKNRLTYDKNVYNLKAFLNKQLSLHFNEEINVDIFSDLLEVLDESWRNAIEGYLNRQRFNLIVEPKAYDMALRLYEQYKDQQGFHGVGIVNVKKLESYTEADDNSLALKLEAKNHHAKLYMHYLMGNVICVDDVGELKLHRRAITKSGMVYSGYVVSSLHPKTYINPFIGQRAIQLQLKQTVEALDEKTKALQLVQDNLTQLMESQALGNALSQHKLGLNLTHYVDYLKTNKALKDKNKEHDALQSTASSELLTLNDQLTIKEKEKESVEKHISEATRQLGKNEQEIKTEKEKETSLIDDISKAKVTLASIASENMVQYQQAQQYFELRFKENRESFHKLDKSYEDKFNNTKSLLSQYRTTLSNLMRDYEYEYNTGYGTEVSSISLYIEQYQRIKDIEIREIKDRLELAKRKSEIGFQESFISKLESAILEARRNIRSLNKFLMERNFNGDRYEFIVEKSKDKIFGQYYDIIMSGQDFVKTDLFMEQLDQKSHMIMQELFEKIAASDNASQNEKDLNKYTDYRQYMNYDIKIHEENGQHSLYSKVFKEKSGGETQVPFYVIIASSFEQTISRKSQESSGCVVLFDEAFNNMDEGRIQAMMEYYNHLNIQVIIAVPPNRVETIGNYVQSMLAVVKKGNHAQTQSYREVS